MYAATFLTVHLKKVLWNFFIAYYSILFFRQNFPRFSNDLDIEMFYWKKPPEVFGRLKKSAERNLNLSKHAKLRIPVQKEKRFSSQRPLQKKIERKYRSKVLWSFALVWCSPIQSCYPEISRFLDYFPTSHPKEDKKILQKS